MTSLQILSTNVELNTFGPSFVGHFHLGDVYLLRSGRVRRGRRVVRREVDRGSLWYR